MQYIKNEHSYCCNNSYNNIILSDYAAVSAIYPVKISKYYAGLINQPNDGIWKQCMPDIRELDDISQSPDPLKEEELSPVPGLIHRYPDRVVLLVSNRCAMYCRFCMRKRLVGCGDAPMSSADLFNAVKYIETHPEIHDVILSGGDPFMLDDPSLLKILTAIRSIKSVSIIRIGTRVPVTFPERVTAELCNMLRKFHPLYINTHFNHPDEITASSATVCSLLADAGIPIGNQTVLLKGVNDSVETMRQLMTGLLKIRVRPYYLHQMDLVKGTAHFRTSIRTGLRIIQGMRGYISGMAIPHYVIDLPGGKGKVALTPDDIKIDGQTLYIRTYTGETVIYEDVLE